ncbi:DUF4097 family beta strand repeat-containing protein [Fulvivirgaceae bacterium BMA10]|uniref:DUF4097 family beta strand repeat-containing protein n=1 Tax=Splendidivirga corallicola TaxID=3051826 RepID=A0ABT8KS21_9BACT|nr:DUF4097 family beta strand repeat-containing protein [Fulvivirgaceae bacterium BMA10]
MKTLKIKIGIMFLVFLMGSAAYAQKEGKLEIPLSDPGQRGKLSADIHIGSIKIIGYEGRNVVVNYKSRQGKVKKAPAEKDGLKRISGSSFDLEASEEDNYVVVESDSWTQGVDLTIQVPKNFDINVSTYNNGEVHVTDVVGEVNAENYNGKITLEKISGSVTADTYNGDIKVTFDKITADTPMAFNTYNGDVDLTLPSSTKAEFKMKTQRGDIFSGFDLQMKNDQPAINNREKSGKQYKVVINNWVRGVINGGGPEFTIKNYNGDIYLRKN